MAVAGTAAFFLLVIASIISIGYWSQSSARSRAVLAKEQAEDRYRQADALWQQALRELEQTRAELGRAEADLKMAEARVASAQTEQERAEAQKVLAEAQAKLAAAQAKVAESHAAEAEAEKTRTEAAAKSSTSDPHGAAATFGAEPSSSQGRGTPLLAVAPFDAARAKQYQEAWAKHLNVPVEMINSVGMKVVLIPPGEFEMGLVPAEIDRLIAEARAKQYDEYDYVTRLPSQGPRHRVRLTRAFYIADHEVTIGEFRRFVQATQYKTDAEKAGESDDRSVVAVFGYALDNSKFGQTDMHPVVNVSWNDAMAFCAWLSREEGEHYRLPTEAEWEYACRAGTTSRFGNEDTLEALRGSANIGDASLALEAIDILPDSWMVSWNDGYPFTAPVRSFKPNAFGLYDMLGNVTEICADWFAFDSYKASPRVDPTGPLAGSERVWRGGAWVDGKGKPICYCAFRSGLAPAAHNALVFARFAWLKRVIRLASRDP